MTVHQEASTNTPIATSLPEVSDVAAPAQVKIEPNAQVKIEPNYAAGEEEEKE